MLVPSIIPVRILYSDMFGSYNVLDVSAFTRYRINHAKLFANRETTSTELRISEINSSGACTNATELECLVDMRETGFQAAFHAL